MSVIKFPKVEKAVTLFHGREKGVTMSTGVVEKVVLPNIGGERAAYHITRIFTTINVTLHAPQHAQFKVIPLVGNSLTEISGFYCTFEQFDRGDFSWLKQDVLDSNIIVSSNSFHSINFIYGPMPSKK